MLTSLSCIMKLMLQLQDSDGIFIAIKFLYALQSMGVDVPSKNIDFLWSLFYASAIQSQNMK